MKTSQNMALLWLIQPSWQVPKPKRRLEAWLSALIGLDFCVNYLKAADPHHTFPEYIIENYQTCFVHYQEAEKCPAKRLKGFLQSVRLTFKQMSSKLKAHEYIM